MTSDTSQPADGLGDGTGTTTTSIDVDVDSLSLQDAVDYRHELILAICHPGLEFDEVGSQKDIDEKAYKSQLHKVEGVISSYGGII